MSCESRETKASIYLLYLGASVGQLEYLWSGEVGFKKRYRLFLKFKGRGAYLPEDYHLGNVLAHAKKMSAEDVEAGIDSPVSDIEMEAIRGYLEFVHSSSYGPIDDMAYPHSELIVNRYEFWMREESGVGGLLLWQYRLRVELTISRNGNISSREVKHLTISTKLSVILRAEKKLRAIEDDDSVIIYFNGTPLERSYHDFSIGELEMLRDNLSLLIEFQTSTGK